MRIDLISVFPQYFSILDLGLLGKAQNRGLLTIKTHNLRDWTHDVHHSVDDTPIGGGAGMVMRPDIWGDCLDDLLEKTTDPVLIFTNPSGIPFKEKDARELSHKENLLFCCGRYEGLDGRIPRYYTSQGIDVREYSIGDYVLNGGEVAACVMVEAITRLIPDFMGNPESIENESYMGDTILLEHPQYTRPVQWRNIEVPPILLSGNHQKVASYNKIESLRRTSQLRPDLIEQLPVDSLSAEEKEVLKDLGWNLDTEFPYRSL